MAHMMRAVLSNSLREEKTEQVSQGQLNTPQLVPIQKTGKRERILMCLASSLTAIPGSPGPVFHLLELDGLKTHQLQTAFPLHWTEQPKPITMSAWQARCQFANCRALLPNAFYPLNSQALPFHQQTFSYSDTATLGCENGLPGTAKQMLCWFHSVATAWFKSISSRHGHRLPPAPS